VFRFDLCLRSVAAAWVSTSGVARSPDVSPLLALRKPTGFYRCLRYCKKIKSRKLFERRS
jgi:hypothetical protein